MVKNPLANARDIREVGSIPLLGGYPPRGWGYPLKEGMATHSSILTWRIPWTEESGGLQSMGP